MKRLAEAAYAADAQTELSAEAREALVSTSDRMSAAIFQELATAGYIVPKKRGWDYAPKAEAYLAAERGKALKNT